MRIGSLFSGYMGLDMAAEHVFGATTAWVADNAPGPRKILAHRAPDVPNLGDITTVDWATVEPVDIITGGSPCQDVSHAGKRAGMTEGTRSNLWIVMREAIATIKPTFVVWENVRGAYSAGADSDLEHCPGCMGDTGDRGPVLRALGRVLGDLSDIGYDTIWHGLRAADIGACHGRFRVFVLAWRRDATHALGEPGGQWRRAASGQAESGRPLGELAGRSGAPVALLPTPDASQFNDGEDPDQWLARRERVKLTAKNLGAPSQMERNTLPLNAQVINLLTQEGRNEETGPREALPSVRRSDGEEAIQWPAGGPGTLPKQEDLLAAMREQQGGHSGRLAPMASATDSATSELRDLRGNGQAARPPQGPRRDEQCSGELDDAVRQLPSEAALAGRPRRTHGFHFGPYEAAVQRWESVLGREAPAPTEPGRTGRPRLSAEFASWMMGLPDGWVTDVPGITRSEALTALGNGVVSQQAVAALTWCMSQRNSIRAAA